MDRLADNLETLPLLHVEFDVPPELQASVLRHQKHLAMLVGNLHAAGVDAAMIETSVQQLVDSYRVELIFAIRAMVGTDGNA